MATTQHRPHGALAGPPFGDFSGRAEAPTSSHPVGKIIQHRPHGAFSGRRFGSFAGKTEGSGGGGSFDLSAPLVAEFEAGFAATGEFSFVSGIPTVTLRLFDKSETGRSAVPDITGIEWAWWDDETLTMLEALATTPTDSGSSESVSGGVCVLSLPSSSKTSGQDGLLFLRLTAGAGSRSLIDTVPVD